MAAEKKVAKKVAKKTTDAPAKKTKKTPGSQKYGLYISKVLKSVHRDIRISGKAMAIMNSFVMDLFARICDEAALLCKRNHSKTLSSREIQTAVRLTLPGELAKHAVNEGSKAVQKFHQKA